MKVELISEFSLQSEMPAAEDIPGEPWHLQLFADGSQSAGRDIDWVDWRANPGHEHEIVWPSPPSPPAKLDQDRKQKIRNGKISDLAPAHAV